LGTIQGTTEFLPISSSAHLVLVPWLFGWDYMGLGFDTALHFGTAIAIVAFFWRDWLDIISRAFKAKNYNLQANSYPPNLLWQVLIASIPAAIAGYLLSDYVETYLHSPILLAINLAVFGIILWLVDLKATNSSKLIDNSHNLKLTTDRPNEANLANEANQAKKNTLKELPLSKINYTQSFIVGLAQTLALVPGVSRSGITMTAGRSLGMNRENSARFSFILSAPATVGAFLFEARKVDWAQTTLPFWLAIIVTVIVGLLTIKYLLKYLQRGSFAIFTIYRIALAIIIVVLFLIR
jgi:undecaprenyl-diphosphatase